MNAVINSPKEHNQEKAFLPRNAAALRAGRDL